MKHSQKTQFYDGIITEVIDGEAKVRCHVPVLGIVTKPIPVQQSFVGTRQAYVMPSVGEHCKVLMDADGNEGLCLGSFYDSQNPPPVSDRAIIHFSFPGGHLFEFNEETGVLRINATKIEIDCSDKVEITSGSESTLSGKPITVTGGVDSAGHPIVSSGQ